MKAVAHSLAPLKSLDFYPYLLYLSQQMFASWRMAVKHDDIRNYIKEAYTLHQDTSSDLSPHEKANQFAGFFACETLSHAVPDQDIISVIAAASMLEAAQKQYTYATQRAKTSANLSYAKAQHEHARTMHRSSAENPPQPFSTEDIPPIEIPKFTPPEGMSATELNDLNTRYTRAFCSAFLAFDDATKTEAEGAFTEHMKTKLEPEFADTYSYLDAFYAFFTSFEFSLIMTLVLLLGIALLALPSIGVGASVVSSTTDYALGTSMSVLGTGFHVWRFFCSTSTPDAPPTSQAETSAFYS